MVEAVLELPLLFKKQWNANNRGELAVQMVVSDHLGRDSIDALARNLGPAWTVGEGLYDGKKWAGGFASMPDRMANLVNAPQDHFLLHPKAFTDAQYAPPARASSISPSPESERSRSFVLTFSTLPLFPKAF